jgi:hypothetical protein
MSNLFLDSLGSCILVAVDFQLTPPQELARVIFFPTLQKTKKKGWVRKGYPNPDDILKNFYGIIYQISPLRLSP